MKYTLSLLLTGIFLITVSCSSQEEVANQQEIPAETTHAEIRNNNGNYQLYVNGEPFWIKGAGLEFGDIASLAAHGGNSFRTWRTDNGQQSGKEVLGEAWEHGLYVTMGLELDRERHGFDYDDEAAVREQFKRIKQEVEALKDHPALIIWAIGNELNLNATNPKVWNAVNEISEYIHQVDTNHLTTTTLAGISPELVNNIKERAPDLDLLSIQMYGDLPNLPRYIDETGWDGPYMVTEWGATGHWEVGTTAWDAPIENNSTEKARLYRERYQRAIASEKEGQCVGSYVFLWGQKQERTPTWYGIFLESGEETESVEAMHYIWNGQWPDNRAPQVEDFQLDGRKAADDIYLQAGTTYPATAEITDADGDSLKYFWEIKPESKDLGEGGDYEAEPESLDGLISEELNSQEIAFMAPKKEGAYRLFVYASDGQKHVAHANIPFFVK